MTGFVCPPDAVDLRVERGLAVVTDPALRASIGRAAAEVVRSRYCTDLIVPQYEAAYLDVLGRR